MQDIGGLVAEQTEPSEDSRWLGCLDQREIATLAVLVLILAGLMTMAAPVFASPDNVEAA